MTRAYGTGRSSRRTGDDSESRRRPEAACQRTGEEPDRCEAKVSLKRAWRPAVLSSLKLREETIGVATRVLIAGGGVAALEAALALRALAEDRVSVELFAPEPQFWYRPLAVAEPFDLGEARQFDLRELAAAAGATFSPGPLTRVDVGGRQAQTPAGSPIP